MFISSIKVNGEATRPGRPFTAEDAPNPQNPYAKSKFDAEHRLFALAAETGLEVSVVRPPLVYGPGVKANFATMMEWVNRGIPLPFGAVNNKRSFVFVDNLADLIILTAIHPKAGGQVFLVSDGEDISTTELLQRMAQALGRTVLDHAGAGAGVDVCGSRARATRSRQPFDRLAAGRHRQDPGPARLGAAQERQRGAAADRALVPEHGPHS